MAGPADCRGTTMELPGGQPAGSHVLMAEGTWKAIQDVAVGDLVLSPQPDGTVLTTSVVATACTPNQLIYQLETQGRSPRRFRCAGDHRLLLFVLQTHRQGGRRSGHTERREMTVEALLARGVRFQEKARVFSTPAIDWPEAALPIHPYIVGCLLGNGCLRAYAYPSSVGLTMRRRLPLYRMRRFGAQFGRVRYHDRAYYTNLVKGAAKLVKGQPYYGTGSRTKFVPDPYTRASLEQRRWLLAGLIDSDGTAKEFLSTSRALAQVFAALFYAFGGWATMRERITHFQGKPCVSYRVHYATADVTIPTQIRYKRHAPRHMAWKNPRNHRFRVTPEGRAEVYALTLASPSAWYITDHWLVTCATGQTIMPKALGPTGGGIDDPGACGSIG